MIMVTTTLFTLFVAQAHANSTLTAPRKLQKIYALGGYNGSSHTNTAEAYDPTTNTWTAIAPMGTARASLAARSRTNDV